VCVSKRILHGVAALLVTTEAVILMETGEPVDLTEDGRQGVGLTPVDPCLRHKMYVDRSPKRSVN